MSKRAVVIGAARHLGFHVAQAALKDGFEVELLVTKRSNNIDRLFAAGAHFSIFDFEDRSSFRRHLEWADVLFHVSLPDRHSTESLLSVERVLHAAIAAGVPRIVYTLSSDALGPNRDSRRLLAEQDRPFHNGTGSPDASLEDRLCDRLIRDHGVDLRRLYTSWLLGPADARGSVPQEFLRTYLRHGHSYSFSGGVSINAVEEAGHAHVAAALSSERHGLYVLGGENLTYHQLYTQLALLSGRSAPRVRIPSGLLAVQQHGVHLVNCWFNRDARAQANTATHWAGLYRWYDSSKAVRDLGYRILPSKAVLEAGLLMERKRAAGTNALFARPHSREFSIRTSDSWADSPLLVTGVPGWLGNRLVEILMNGDRAGVRYPHRKVHLLVQPHQHTLFDLPENFRVFAADLTRRPDLSQALAGVETVLHLFGATHPRRVETLYRLNTQATRTLADACIKAGVRRFLYLSSDSVCAASGVRVYDEDTPPAPLDDYGRSKCLAEEYLLKKCRSGDLDVTILREFWAFGPFAPQRQERFLSSLRKSRQIIFGDGKRLRSVSHVDNTVAALLAAERSPLSIGRIYWIGEQKYDYTIDEVHSLLCEALGHSYRPLYLPAQTCTAARLVSRVLRSVGRLHPVAQSVGNFDCDRAGRIDAAQRDFAYSPIISFPEYVQELARRGRPDMTFRKASAG